MHADGERRGRQGGEWRGRRRRPPAPGHPPPAAAAGRVRRAAQRRIARARKLPRTHVGEEGRGRHGGEGRGGKGRLSTPGWWQRRGSQEPLGLGGAFYILYS